MEINLKQYYVYGESTLTVRVLYEHTHVQVVGSFTSVKYIRALQIVYSNTPSTGVHRPQPWYEYVLSV